MSGSPWGAIDHAELIAPGIRWVSTPSHGGLLLDAARVARMPAYFTAASWAGPSAYEEDVDWCMPALIFAEEFKACPRAAGMVADAESTLRNWHPEVWEKHYGRELKPGESMRRDEDESKKAHAADLVVVAAWGNWHASVPPGMVGVAACKGGRNKSGQYAGPLAYFHVPAAEYAERTEPCGFVIDQARHAPCSPIT